MDIHSETVALVQKYIASPDMIVLVVLPAVDDFHNAEAIKLCRKVDADGARTLGVVTKADITPPEMHVKDKLMMTGKNQVKLKLGFIAVRNRTASECENDMSTEELRRAEQQLFSTHPALKGLPQTLWGTGTLVSRIVELQQTRVEECLPRLRREVQSSAAAARKALEALPPPLDSDTARQLLFFNAITAVGMRFKDATYGIFEAGTDAPLCVCARTIEMYETFDKALRNATPDFLSDEYFDIISEMLINTRGSSLPNFLRFPVFAQLLRDTFDTPLVSACETLVSDVRTYIQHTVLEPLLRTAFPSHHILSSEVIVCLQQFLDEQTGQLRKSLADVIKSQAHIFTLNHYYSVRGVALPPDASVLRTLLLH